MSMESTLTAALQALAPGRVYPDVAPVGAVRPYITYQQVGGSSINFIDPTLPDKRNSRVQINVWADNRKAAAELARLIEDTIRVTTALQPTVLGSFTSDYETDTKLFGTMQDFSFWT